MFPINPMRYVFASRLPKATNLSNRCDVCQKPLEVGFWMINETNPTPNSSHSQMHHFLSVLKMKVMVIRNPFFEGGALVSKKRLGTHSSHSCIEMMFVN